MRTRGSRWGLLGDRRQLLRFVLWSLAAGSLATGLFATLAPRSFYGHVPGVDLLPPFNQHLLSDVGGFYLGFALLFSWAAMTLGRELVAATCAAWTLTQTLHFAYHAFHLDSFSVGEAALQTALLALLLSGPLLAALLMRSDRTRDPGGRDSDRLWMAGACLSASRDRRHHDCSKANSRQPPFA